MAKAKTSPRKPKPAAKQPRSIITFLLDRSGSMSAIKNATIEGFNTYLTGLQGEAKAQILFTFLQFDSLSLDKVHVSRPVKEVPLLTDATFAPRGGTPLIDAAYATIRAVEEAVTREDVKSRVVICIQTDGEENQSKDHTWDDLALLVKAKQEAGWQFNFMGAGIDAYSQAARMNIAAANTLSYNAQNLQATRQAYGASAQNSSSFSAGLTDSTNYTTEQKFMSGDVYDPDLRKKKPAPPPSQSNV